jgi:hypothetical protein
MNSKSRCENEKKNLKITSRKKWKKIQISAKEEFLKTESSLNEREKKIIDQENFIRDQQLKNSKIIKLNVGGKRFTTTLTTLTSDKDSMLAAMFSGRYSLEKDEEGYHFIDRNGEYFSFILDYLRTGQLSSTAINDNILTELKKEVQYYQLSAMVDLPSLETAPIMNYSGIYINDDRILSFIDDRQAFFFTNGRYQNPKPYTIDPLNFVHFNQETFFLCNNQLRLGNKVYEYKNPALPENNICYENTHNSTAIYFNASSIVFQEISGYDRKRHEIQTIKSTTKNGIPMIVTVLPVPDIYWDNFQIHPIFYCFGAICIACSNTSVRIFKKK